MEPSFKEVEMVSKILVLRQGRNSPSLPMTTPHSGPWFHDATPTPYLPSSSSLSSVLPLLESAGDHYSQDKPSRSQAGIRPTGFRADEHLKAYNEAMRAFAVD